MTGKKPAWISRPDVKKKSSKKEQKRAKELGGKAQPGSGNKFYAKGDIKFDDYLVEHKYTDKKSYPLTKEIFLKIDREELGLFLQRRCNQLKKNIMDREEIIINLTRAKSKNDYDDVLFNYTNIIEICDNLNDIEGIQFYNSELKEYFRNNERLKIFKEK